MHIEKFQYLTYDVSNKSHEYLAKKACEAGCKWIQLRTKNKSFSEWVLIAKTVKKITDKYNCKLIINDSVEVCKAISADGVHLGENDMSPKQARKVLGTKAIIGGTANTFEDIKKLNQEGVDYIGCGPFRFTTTKKNLSPIVGIEGYKLLVEKMNQAQMDIPLIAIGGINIHDIDDLLKAGIHGIAVSGAIHSDGNIAENTSEFLKLLY